MLFARHRMSTKKTRTRARSKHRPGALEHFYFSAAHIRKKHIARQHRTKVFDGVDYAPDVRRKDDNVAANARARRVLYAGIDSPNLLSLDENSLLVRANDANTPMTQRQGQRTTNQTGADNCDLLDHSLRPFHHGATEDTENWKSYIIGGTGAQLKDRRCITESGTVRGTDSWWRGIVARSSSRPITRDGKHSHWDVWLALQALGRQLLSREISCFEDARLLLREI